MPETWLSELDAAIAAPVHHRLLIENDRVRVFETRIEPGDTVPLHTHQWPATYYVLAWGEMIRRDDKGNVTLDTRGGAHQAAPGQAIWAAPIAPHTLENVGATAIHVVSIEIKS